MAAVTSMMVAPEAGAVGWLGDPATSPVEQRVALSVSEERSVLYVQFRFESQGGPFAVIVPTVDGAALDWASRAFFEALEDSTAPRVLAPESIDATCGNTESPAAHVFGDVDGSPPLEPIEVQVFDDSNAVQTWASESGLTPGPTLTSALDGAAPGVRFVVARFDAPAGTSLSKTLRVVSSSSSPSLPLGFTSAGSSPLRVVTWTIGEGRAALAGTEVQLDDSKLALRAAEESSNYASLLAEALDAPADAVLVDLASHASLRAEVSLSKRGPAVPSFIQGYFSRAAGYGETVDPSSSCIAQGAAILDQSAKIGTACPRGDLGVVGGGAGCTAHGISPGEVDPTLLACGPGVDDLAIILSDFEADETWLTRTTLILAPDGAGSERAVTFPGGPQVGPGLHAASVDLSGCPEGAGGMGSGGAGSQGGGPGSDGGPNGDGSGVVEVPVYGSDGCTCEGGPDLVGYVEEPESDAPDAYYVDEACTGDTSDTYYADDGCSGTDTGESDYEYVDDSCGESSYESDSYEDCGGDTTDTSDDYDSCSDTTDTSGSSDSCSGDDDGWGDDGAESSAAGPALKKRRPRRKLSTFVYGAIAFIVPLRRLGRRRVASPTNE